MPRPLLVPFIALAAWIGFGYLLGDPIRTATPSFESARGLAPMTVWGLMFLAGAATLTAAAFIRDDRPSRVALFIGGVIYAWWAALFALTAWQDARASLNAPALYGFLAVIHFLAAAPELLDHLRRKAPR